MTKRFVIATDPLTEEQEKKFKDALNKALWWHWLPNFWLLKDTNEVYSTTAIADKLYAINSKARCLALEVDQITWSALTRPDAKGNSMSKWIIDHWHEDQTQQRPDSV